MQDITASKNLFSQCAQLQGRWLAQRRVGGELRDEQAVITTSTHSHDSPLMEGMNAPMVPGSCVLHFLKVHCWLAWQQMAGGNEVLHTYSTAVPLLSIAARENAISGPGVGTMSASTLQPHW